tara:strand:+ start:253 stop:573 length:321 start_codon:yes stop_codon:yes gene_type:complete
MPRELLQLVHATPTEGLLFEVKFVPACLVDTPCDYQGFTSPSEDQILVTPTVFDQIVDDCYEHLGDDEREAMREEGYYDPSGICEESGFMSIHDSWSPHLLGQEND